MKVEVGGVYKHFKGKYYEVIAIAHDSNDCTSEPYVVYKQLHESDMPFGTVWHRRYLDFISTAKNAEGFTVDRFELVKVKR